jgi:hypothetical protein
MKEHSFKLFKNHVLRRIFSRKREAVIRDLRKLRSEELRDMYSSQNYFYIIKLK